MVRGGKGGLVKMAFVATLDGKGRGVGESSARS